MLITVLTNGKDVLLKLRFTLKFAPVYLFVDLLFRHMTGSNTPGDTMERMEEKKKAVSVCSGTLVVFSTLCSTCLYLSSLPRRESERGREQRGGGRRGERRKEEKKKREDWQLT